MECLCAREVQLWKAYEKKHGTLDWIARSDWNAAMLASMYANSKRRSGTVQFKQADFMRWSHEVPISLEQAIDQWS